MGLELVMSIIDQIALKARLRSQPRDLGSFWPFLGGMALIIFFVFHQVINKITQYSQYYIYWKPTLSQQKKELLFKNHKPALSQTLTGDTVVITGGYNTDNFPSISS